MRITKLTTAALLGAAILFAANWAQAANPRIALVIGEAAYPDGALPTTANDAGLVAQVLQAAGFDVVGARDLDGQGVRQALRDFLDKANAVGPDMQAFVYVSGRAIQYSGDNYIAPIDARIARAADAPIEAVKISDFTHALAATPGIARVVVIDGARANPYAQQGDPLAGGLALVDPEPNTVIAFNAAPGALGVQDAGDYGVYAKSLTGFMRQGGVDIVQVFEQVRLDVNQQTQGAQIPWSAGKLAGPYFIFERAADAPPPKRPPARKPVKDMPVEEAYAVCVERDTFTDYEWFQRTYPDSQQARRVRAILAARREALFWRRALDRNNPPAYWTYLRRYPHGPHAWDAYRRLDVLAASHAPPPDFALVEYDGLPPPPEAEIVYADRPYYYFGGDDYGPPPPPPPPAYFVEYDDGWRQLPPPPRPTVIGLLPALAIAIPLGVAARAYYARPAANGVAPATASAPPPPRAFGPPPLPAGVRPVAVPTVAAPAAPAPAAAATTGGAGAVRFAAPTTPAAVRPTAPAATPAAAAPAATRPLPTPTQTPTPAAAAPAATRPLPTPSATPAAAAPAATRPLPTPTPTAAATPAAAAAPAATRPLPTPSATPAAAAPAATRPVPTPSAAPAAAATPAAAAPAATRPLPTPSATPAVTRPPPPPTPTPTAAAAPAVVRTPAVEAPLRGSEPASKPSRTKAPHTGDGADSVEPPKPPPARTAPKPAAEARPAVEPPRAAVEPPRPAVEPPRPAAEAPKPPPPPAVTKSVVEALKPPPKPAPPKPEKKEPKKP